MTVALLAISDGRHAYHEQALRSALEHLPRFDQYVFIDDARHDLGFAGAVQAGWEQILASGADWCFWLEADFTFNRPVDVSAMQNVLRAHPYLVQMALLRQPCNAEERAVGGVVQTHPDDYEPNHWHGLAWLEHRRCFTTNPCLVPTWIMRRGWPQCVNSEGHFGLNLFASDAALRAAYWGEGEEWVTHIGESRSGHSY